MNDSQDVLDRAHGCEGWDLLVSNFLFFRSALLCSAVLCSASALLLLCFCSSRVD